MTDTRAQETLTPDLAQTLAFVADFRRSHEQSQRQVKRFRTLVELGRDLTAAGTLDTLCAIALARALSFSQHDGGSVLLLAKAGGPLVVRTSAGAEAVPPGTRVADLDRSIAGRALRKRQPILVEGRGEAIGTSWRAYSQPIPSAVCLPLLTTDGDTLGVLALKSTRRPRPLDQSELDALQLLAGQLATAIRAVDLQERLQQSLDTVLSLYEAGRALAESLDPTELARRVLEIATGLASCEAGVLSSRDARGYLRVWHSHGPEAVWGPARRTSAARAARRAAIQRQAVQAFRLSGTTEGPALAGWCVPLHTRGQLLAMLELYGMVDEATSSGEVLGSLAQQAATALENARLYQTLAERERRLEELVAQLLSAQEDERRRVAYDLHDGVAQTAAGTYQHLQAYRARHAPREADGREALDTVIALARQTVRETRGVIAGLRPTVLDDFGLEQALRREVERLSEQGWEATYASALGPERLPGPVETALFRVAQEALRNVEKHAGKHRLHVQLERGMRTVRLEVRDWGRGFRPGAVGPSQPGERVGLASMEERVRVLGGHVRVLSRPGAGTRLIADVPLANGPMSEVPGGE